MTFHQILAQPAVKYKSEIFLPSVGIVYYQHRNLHRRNHGFHHIQSRLDEKSIQDYENWKEGLFLPTPSQLKKMEKKGFRFPKGQKTVHPKDKRKKIQVKKPDLSFLE